MADLHVTAISGVAGLTVVSRGPAELAAFYERALGMRVRASSDVNAPFQCQLGPTCLAIRMPREGEPAPVPQEFAFRTHALRPLLARLLAAGVPLEGPTTTDWWCLSDWREVVLFKDPDGNRVTLEGHGPGYDEEGMDLRSVLGSFPPDAVDAMLADVDPLGAANAQRYCDFLRAYTALARTQPGFDEVRALALAILGVRPTPPGA